jgi:predicted HTH transcriptional regulator
LKRRRDDRRCDENIMFVPKPPFPTDIDKFSVFPCYENIYFEFKRNLQTFDTLTKAICGMLNRKGGYIIFGVDDETHKIRGVKNTPKLIDDFSQYVDKLTGQKYIITSNNQPLHADNIVIDLVPHPIGLLVVLNVTPLEDVQYKLIDGSSYVRLNATTWNLKQEEKLYKMGDVEHIVLSRTSELNRFKRRAQEKIIKLHCEYEALDEEKNTIQRHLFDKILREKEAAEKELAAAAAFKFPLWCCFI